MTATYYRLHHFLSNIINTPNSVQIISPSPSNGVVLAMEVVAVPYTRDINGQYTTTDIFFWVTDGASTELFGTDQASGHKLVVDPLNNDRFGWENPNRSDLYDGVEIMRHMSLTAAAPNAPGTYRTSLSLTAHGDATNPHSLMIVTEVFSFDT